MATPKTPARAAKNTLAAALTAETGMMAPKPKTARMKGAPATINHVALAAKHDAMADKHRALSSQHIAQAKIEAIEGGTQPIMGEYGGITVPMKGMAKVKR